MAKKTTVSPRRNVGSPGRQAVILRAFAAGVGLCLLLLAFFAALLAHTALPLTLVRPFACCAAAAGAAVSGVILSAGIGRQLLLCGVGCGLFYAGCQLAASFALYQSGGLEQMSVMLPVVLFFSGTAGGALAALRSSR